MPHSRRRRCITIPFDYGGLAVLLWVTAVALMVADMFQPASYLLANWSILAGIGATASTIVACLTRAHRAGLQLLSYEARRTREVVAARLPEQRAVDERLLRGV